ncbi:MAG: ABC transporter substrate-binding protein [Pseudomonadota bacterium]
MLFSLLLCLAGSATAEAPQPGGELNVGTVYVTLAPLSWDPQDWNWKANHDTSMVREQLFAADLELSQRKGGPYSFVADAYIPEDAVRGELAESWRWLDDLSVEVKLRKGVFFAAKPGVMQRRELTAEDVLFSFNNLDRSPKKIGGYFDHIERIEVVDRYTLIFHFTQFNAEWKYRFGYGYYSSIVPREMANIDAKNWRNLVGTGPFSMERYIRGNSQTYAKNPDYWDRVDIDGESHQLPFIDKLHYRIIKDEATYLTALRTGKLDILESIRWIAVEHLKETTPELKWHRWLSMSGNIMVMRQDFAPFKDVRVRRALNLAVNQQEIVELFYNGHAELMAFPQHPFFGPYFQPLEEMPADVQELFEYKPEKARQLLAEAGFADGFDLPIQVCSCSPSNMDLIPLLERYLAKIGVRVTIEPLEYASYLSMMTSRNHTPGYLMHTGHVNPTTTLRKNFMTGQLWNPSLHADPEFDRKLLAAYQMRNETERVAALRELTREVMADAPYLFLPIQYLYTAWWPWVKNYGGELRAGAVRPGPIYARLWIDQKMKRAMGFLH